MMTTVAHESAGGEFELAPHGTHIARCYRVIDLGTQYNERWQTRQRKIFLAWELPTEMMGDGRPFSIGSRYTLSLSEKAYLRRDLESWRGRAFTEEERQGFDVKNVLGAPCMLSIVHNTTDGKTYANVASIMALPRGMECLPPVNSPVYFDIDAPDMAVFANFTDSMKNVIQSSEEWQSEKSPEPAAEPEDFDDDIPF